MLLLLWCTSDNTVNIGGVEKESNKCLIPLQKILLVVSNSCIKQKGTERHPEHNSHESDYLYLGIRLGLVVKPKELEDIAIMCNNRNHDECLFQVSSQGDLNLKVGPLSIG